MGCFACDLQIGKIYTFDFSVTCDNCANYFDLIKVNVFYHFKNKGIHHFKILDNVYCPECKTQAITASAPCGGSYYFNESDVSESLLLPNEFIINK